MLKELLPYFEKNILKNDYEKESLLAFDKAKIREYLNLSYEIALAELEDPTLAFKKVMDSEYVNEIWKSLTASVSDKKIAFRTQHYSKYFQSFGNPKSDNCLKLFTIDELTYLITGEISCDVSKNPMDQKWFKLLKKHLKKDVTCVNLPISPVVFKTCPSISMIGLILDTLEFKVPKGMSILDYYDRTFGLIDKYPLLKTKKAILDYLENSEESDEVVRELYQLFSKYDLEPMGFEYNGYKNNDLGVLQIKKAVNELLTEKGLDYFLNLKTKESAEQLAHLIEGLIDVNLMNQSSEDFSKFIVDLNKVQKKFDFDYQMELKDSVIHCLINQAKQGNIEDIYISTVFIGLSLSDETLTLMNENKHLFNFKETVKTDWIKSLESHSEKMNDKITESYRSFENRCNIKFILNTIFGTKLDHFSCAESDSNMVEENRLSVQKFYENNRHCFKETIKKLAGKEVSVIEEITDEGILGLIELEKTM